MCRAFPFAQPTRVGKPRNWFGHGHLTSPEVAPAAYGCLRDMTAIM